MSFSLMDKLLGKPVVVTKEVAGRQVVYRVLTNRERVEIWKRNPTTDLLTAPETIAPATLAKAIQSIDGTKLSDADEIKELHEQFPQISVDELVEKHLATYPYPVVNELYMGYVSVVEEFQQQLMDLKKNSTPLSPEPSGESVKSSAPTL